MSSFQERFKGKTSKMGKDGIQSLDTNTPINRMQQELTSFPEPQYNQQQKVSQGNLSNGENPTQTTSIQQSKNHLISKVQNQLKTAYSEKNLNPNINNNNNNNQAGQPQQEYGSALQLPKINSQYSDSLSQNKSGNITSTNKNSNTSRNMKQKNAQQKRNSQFKNNAQNILSNASVDTNNNDSNKNIIYSQATERELPKTDQPKQRKSFLGQKYQQHSSNNKNYAQNSNNTSFMNRSNNNNTNNQRHNNHEQIGSVKNVNSQNNHQNIFRAPRPPSIGHNLINSQINVSQKLQNNNKDKNKNGIIGRANSNADIYGLANQNNLDTQYRPNSNNQHNDYQLKIQNSQQQQQSQNSLYYQQPQSSLLVSQSQKNDDNNSEYISTFSSNMRSQYVPYGYKSYKNIMNQENFNYHSLGINKDNDEYRQKMEKQNKMKDYAEKIRKNPKNQKNGNQDSNNASNQNNNQIFEKPQISSMFPQGYQQQKFGIHANSDALNQKNFNNGGKHNFVKGSNHNYISLSNDNSPMLFDQYGGPLKPFNQQANSLSQMQNGLQKNAQKEMKSNYFKFQKPVQPLSHNDIIKEEEVENSQFFFQNSMKNNKQQNFSQQQYNNQGMPSQQSSNQNYFNKNGSDAGNTYFSSNDILNQFQKRNQIRSNTNNNYSQNNQKLNNSYATANNNISNLNINNNHNNDQNVSNLFGNYSKTINLEHLRQQQTPNNNNINNYNSHSISNLGSKFKQYNGNTNNMQKQNNQQLNFNILEQNALISNNDEIAKHLKFLDQF